MNKTYIFFQLLDVAGPQRRLSIVAPRAPLYRSATAARNPRRYWAKALRMSKFSSQSQACSVKGRGFGIFRNFQKPPWHIDLALTPFKFPRRCAENATYALMILRRNTRNIYFNNDFFNLI